MIDFNFHPKFFAEAAAAVGVAGSSRFQLFGLPEELFEAGLEGVAARTAEDELLDLRCNVVSLDVLRIHELKKDKWFVMLFVMVL